MKSFTAMAKRMLCAVLVALTLVSVFTVPAFAKVGQTYESRVQGLRAHAGPNGTSEIVFKLEKGEKVIHKATSKGWWFIKTKDGKEGYVYRTYLKATGNPIKKDALYKVYKITNLAVRKAPRSAADKLGTIRRGTTVQLKNKRGDWGYIKLSNGKQGWVQLKYLSYVSG